MVRSVAGGLLVQEQDRRSAAAADLEGRDQAGAERSGKSPTCCSLSTMLLSSGRTRSSLPAAARRSTAQLSRVDSVKIAAAKAAEFGTPTQGSVLASDAFFPFADGLETGIAAGITAVIQPGGSRRDEEVIAAADKAGIAMVFSGLRHFRH